MYIVQAFLVAILVVVGLAVLLYLWNGSKEERKDEKMNGARIAGKAMKWGGGFAGVLGLAFFFGSFQAYVQGFPMQILPLGVAGVVCLIAGIICFVMGIRKVKYVE